MKLRNPPLELLELGLDTVVAAEVERPVHVVDNRIKGIVAMEWRAAKGEPRGTLAVHMRLDRGEEPRFADAGLAAEQHDMTVPVLHMRPALGQRPISDLRPTIGVARRVAARSRVSASISASMR